MAPGNSSAIWQECHQKSDLEQACLDEVGCRFTQANTMLARTTAAYCKEWQRAQEMTSSSALGIHFGHYIAGTFNPEILVINSAMADILLCTGFSYDRWWKGLNIMIEKTTDDFNVENYTLSSCLKWILMQIINGLDGRSCFRLKMLAFLPKNNLEAESSNWQSINV